MNGIRLALLGLGVLTLAFVASGLFMILPGPNLVAYSFLFRFAGQLQRAADWTAARPPGL
jgi:hypothetical protein